MKAVIYTMYGGPEVLQFTQLVKPVPKDKEILIKVHASTVSAGTIWMRKGKFPGSILLTMLLRLITGITRPRRLILGFEFSGVVEETGQGVTRFKKGDKVYGTTTGLKNGSYADYICVPEKWSQGVVMLKPGYLSFEEAAALPVGAMTALHLLQKAKIEPAKKVLIYGASGSVGSFAVQIAKYFGATVTAVSSTFNKELALSIGADHFIDYTKEDISLCEEKFDIIFDAVAKRKASAFTPLLNKQGKFCSVRTPTCERTEYLSQLEAMILKGALLPVIDRVYPFSAIVEAHRYVDRGHKKGNVVLAHNTAITEAERKIIITGKDDTYVPLLNVSIN